MTDEKKPTKQHPAVKRQAMPNPTAAAFADCLTAIENVSEVNDRARIVRALAAFYEVELDDAESDE